MNRARTTVLLAAGATFASAALAEPRFSAEDLEKGRIQYHRTCAQCHGFNMVNAGTSAYNLRRFPLEQADRFLNSVTNGKGNMPSFKESLTPEQIESLWAYVGSRGGKEP